MRIALYGGSFNPVHNEHVNIVKAALSTLKLDKLIVVPTYITPAKDYAQIAPAENRLECCRIAFGDCPFVEISDYEIKKEGVSYTYLTCRHFKDLYPKDELYFLLGGDALASFADWKNPEKILECVTLAACARENDAALDCEIERTENAFSCKIIKVGYVGKSVSSTKIRALASLGENIESLVPQNVAEFLKSKQLYLLPQISNVKKYLTEARWRHTVGVVIFAAENADRLKVRERDAIIAAALHDSAKNLSLDSDELKGLTLPENTPPPVVHQYAGAYLSEYVFCINDKDILNAVRYHCSGRENMSPLEKLIYLADLLEDGRSFDEVDELRRKFKKSVDGALCDAFRVQLEYILKSGKDLCSLTVRAYEFLKNNGEF